ncbi:MAG TPA: hypothetical protein VKG25_01435 [Bryobacteraceae bacterium]|nr:hypothetical protein [Bryobacteraceae bacterium]
MNLEWIGWLATAVFAGSYVLKDAGTLRKIQACAAVLWVIYGLIIHSSPVVAANVSVAGMALWSALSREKTSRTEA